jgi:hypothetical protein
MEVQLEAGVSIDLATRADLAAAHERLAGQLPGLVEADYEIKPAYAVTGTPTKPLLLDFGAPPAGLLWLVEFVSVWGVDPTGNGSVAAIANVSGALFVGRILVPDAIATPTIQAEHDRVAVPAFAVPSAFEPPGRVFVRYPDRLYALLSGSGLAAGASVYHATAGVLKATDTRRVIAVL